jgi:hypothetical protein
VPPEGLQDTHLGRSGSGGSGRVLRGGGRGGLRVIRGEPELGNLQAGSPSWYRVVRINAQLGASSCYRPATDRRGLEGGRSRGVVRGRGGGGGGGGRGGRPGGAGRRAGSGLLWHVSQRRESRGRPRGVRQQGKRRAMDTDVTRGPVWPHRGGVGGGVGGRGGRGDARHLRGTGRRRRCGVSGRRLSRMAPSSAVPGVEGRSRLWQHAPP